MNRDHIKPKYLIADVIYEEVERALLSGRCGETWPEIWSKILEPWIELILTQFDEAVMERNTKDFASVQIDMMTARLEVGGIALQTCPGFGKPLDDLKKIAHAINRRFHKAVKQVTSD